MLERKIKKILLDLFFPKKCLGCNRSDTYLCRACFNKIEILPEIYKKQGHLDKVIAAASYKNPLVRKMIKRFKYDYVRELAQPLSQLLIKKLSQCWMSHLQHNVLLMPIPLYRFRQRKRGFNQAEILAKKVAEHFNLILETNILKRIIPTEPQANIKNDDQKRKTNIKDVFNVNPEHSIQGKIIILIDDVATTGATLSEAAKVLKNSGANEIWGLVVAKG